MLQVPLFTKLPLFPRFPWLYSQWVFLLHKTVYVTPPPLVNKYVFTLLAAWLTCVIYCKKRFFIPFVLRVGVRNEHAMLRDGCRFLLSVLAFMVEQTRDSK